MKLDQLKNSFVESEHSIALFFLRQAGAARERGRLVVPCLPGRLAQYILCCPFSLAGAIRLTDDGLADLSSRTGSVLYFV